MLSRILNKVEGFDNVLKNERGCLDKKSDGDLSISLY